MTSGPLAWVKRNDFIDKRKCTRDTWLFKRYFKPNNFQNRLLASFPKICSPVLSFIISVYRTRVMMMVESEPGNHLWYLPSQPPHSVYHQVSLILIPKFVPSMHHFHHTTSTALVRATIISLLDFSNSLLIHLLATILHHSNSFYTQGWSF